MTDTLLERVTLPQGRRMRGGLLANAEPLPDGWESGITFRTWACGPEPEIIAVCDVIDSVADSAEERPGSGVFHPIIVRASAACSTMPTIGLSDMAMNRLEGTTEWALGRVLATGGGSTNPSFEDATNVHAGDLNLPGEAIAAVSCLEAAASDTGYGAEITLHAPVRAAAWLRATGMMNDDRESPAGFRWIISPGYPVGGAVEDGVTVNIWATGPVFAASGPAQVLTDSANGGRIVLPKYRQNYSAPYAARDALVAFDPCLNLTATFVVPACNGES